MEILLWLAVIVLHELGHYGAFRLCGYKPIFNLRWYGIQIGSNCLPVCNLLEVYLIAAAGIILGTIPLTLYQGYGVGWNMGASIPPIQQVDTLVYILMCGFDLYAMITSMLLIGKYKHWGMKLWKATLMDAQEDAERFGWELREVKKNDRHKKGNLDTA